MSWNLMRAWYHSYSPERYGCPYALAHLSLSLEYYAMNVQIEALAGLWMGNEWDNNQ